MFRGCTNLKYLDISNFDVNTSNTSMISFLDDCTKLEYINMEHFIEGNYTLEYNIFSDAPENLVYCPDNNLGRMDNLISDLETAKMCVVNDCSDNWRKNKQKLVFDIINYLIESCTEQCAQAGYRQFSYDYICLEYCPSGTHFVTIDDEKECVIDCQEGMIFEKNGECVDNCSSIDFFKKNCRLFDEYNKQHLDFIIDKIRQEITSLEYSIITYDLKAKYKNVTFRVTTAENMKINENNEFADETQIILGEVDNRIKTYYNLPYNQTLFIYKLDYYFEEFLIPITKYEIYIPGDHSGINLEYVKNKFIKIKIPVNINENEIYKYDPNSEYYNNSCYPNSSTPSQNCQDQRILNSRKIEYNKGNMSICEIDCVFVSYNLSTKKVECQCPVKSFSSFSEIYNSRNNRTNLFFYFDNITYYEETIETTNIPTTINQKYSDYNIKRRR